jgi:hypothetical protein
VDFVLPFPMTRQVPVRRWITGSPDSKQVNPESKGLTRFNPGSTPGLSGFNPWVGDLTPTVTPKTSNAATRKLPAAATLKYYSKEKANCQGESDEMSNHF